MSLINITVDTEEDTVKCNVDGTEVPNVQYINVCLYRNSEDDECHVEICTYPEEMGHHVKRVTRIVTASKVDASKDEVQSTSPDKTLAICHSLDPIISSINKWFKR